VKDDFGLELDDEAAQHLEVANVGDVRIHGIGDARHLEQTGIGRRFERDAREATVSF
jgi:hypothetical protein